MGCSSSRPSGYEGGGQVTLGGSTAPATGPGPDRRTAAAEAAERRKQAAQQRGTNSSNPKAGQLAAKAAQQNNKTYAEPREPERLVWD